MLRSTLGLVLLARSSATVLIMGDSLLEFSGRAMSEFCAGQSFVNMAVGGTNASQWGTPGGGTNKPQHCEDIPHKPCRPDAGFGLNPLIPFTHVWFSVGSNDWMQYHCRPEESQWADLKKNLQMALDNIVAAANNASRPDVPIVMFKYVTPGMLLKECVRKLLAPKNCTGPGTCGANNDCVGCTMASCSGCKLDPMTYDEMHDSFTRMNTVVQDACESHPSKRCVHITPPDFPALSTARSQQNKTYPDSFDQCVYHRDGIHLNNNAFCRMLTAPQAQKAFGCEEATYDCNKVGTMIPGSPKLVKIEGQCTDYVADPQAIDPFDNNTSTKTDYHFQLLNTDQKASEAIKNAIKLAETEMTLEKEIAELENSTKSKAEIADLKMKAAGEKILHANKSPFFEGSAGTALRGLLDIDDLKRMEVWPGFVVYHRLFPTSEEMAYKAKASTGPTPTEMTQNSKTPAELMARLASGAGWRARSAKSDMAGGSHLNQKGWKLFKGTALNEKTLMPAQQ
jgi:hypothetical protein